MVILLLYSFKWQNMAGAGSGAEIMDKGGAGVGAENNNIGSATLISDLIPPSPNPPNPFPIACSGEIHCFMASSKIDVN